MGRSLKKGPFADPKLLEKIEKDYPDTPWAVLAKRDKGTALGLDIQEGRVD